MADKDKKDKEKEKDKAQEKDDDALLREFFSELGAVERDNEVNRILTCFKLNPFEHLNLAFDSKPEDVKRAYRKVSLMIHPDKCKHPQAQEAFNIVQKAQETLQNAEERAYLESKFKEAKDILLKDRRKKLKNDNARRIQTIINDGKAPVDEYEFSDEFRELWRVKVRELLTEEEWRRRKLQKRIKEEEQRIEKDEQETKQTAEKKKKHDKDWEETRETRVSSWRDFMKGGKKSAKGATKPPKLKEEDAARSYVQRPVKRG